MHLKDFDFELPKELIAQYPCRERTSCRLLCLDGNTGGLTDTTFVSLIDCLNPGDLMVFNDTRVIPARIFGNKATGGAVELLVERMISTTDILAHIRSSRSPKPGSRLVFSGGYEATVTGRQDDLFEVSFAGAGKSVLEILDLIGHVPLPPYIERPDQDADRDDYQTVYGKVPGAVAAPTAGLHFDLPFMNRIREKGIRTAFVTLHVGAGTFQPVKTENIEEHHMHSEYACMPEETAQMIRETKAAGGRIVAVGTTSVRTLESAAAKYGSIENLKAYSDFTDIFIYPGYRYRVTDALVTNFHLPQSTLIMLVSAFAGYRHTMDAYKHAVDSKYRFFSYGDAMFITRKDTPDEI
jgi:S-adenosylmethionine:tRNA ribosyltransferase-isomerase